MADLGMPTLIETAALPDCAAVCHDLGLQFIELNMNLPHYQIDQMDPAQFLEIGDRYRIFFTIHLDERLDVSDFNPLVAEAYQTTVHQTIAFGRAIGCPILNMHLSSGVYFTMPDEKVYLYERYRDHYLQSMVRFRDECERAIDGGSMRICVENAGRFSDFQLTALDLLLASPVFGLTFDIGHSYRHGGADEAVILERAQRLAHMHAHDVRDGKDHLPLGSGEMELLPYLALAEERHCRIVLETKTVAGLRQSVGWYRDAAERGF